MFKTKNTDKVRFDVSVNKIKNLSSDDVNKLLKSPKKSNWKKFTSKLSAGIIITSIAGVSFFAGAGPANAGGVGDVVKEVIDLRQACTAGNFGYTMEPRSQAPDTKNAEDLVGRTGLGSPNAKTLMSIDSSGKKISDPTKATIYERYGMSGLTWTNWIGPDNPEGLKGETGKYGGAGVLSDTGLVHINENKRGLIASDDSVVGKYPHFYNSTKECLPAGEIFKTNIANSMHSITKGIIYLTNSMFELSYETTDSTIAKFLPESKNVMDLLFNSVFKQLIGFVMLLVAITAAYSLYKKQFTQVLTLGIWLMVTMVVGLFLAANSTWLYEKSNYVMNEGINLTAQILDDSSKTIDTKNPTSVDVLCHARPAAGEKPNTTVIRSFQCKQYYQWGYLPWVTGQWGSTPGTGFEVAPDGFAVNPEKTSGVEMKIKGEAPLADSGAVTFNGYVFANSRSIKWLDNKVIKTDKIGGMTTEDRTTQGAGLMNETLHQLHTDGINNVNFAGKNGSKRIELATTSLIGATASGIVVASLSASMIILRLSLFLSMFVLPFILLAAAHEGKGRRIAEQYAFMLLNIIIKAIIISALIPLMVFLFSLFANVSSASWIFSIIMMLILAISFMKFKNIILQMFTLRSSATEQNIIQTSKTAIEPVVNKARQISEKVIPAGLILHKAMPRGKAASNDKARPTINDKARPTINGKALPAKASSTTGMHGEKFTKLNKDKARPTKSSSNIDGSKNSTTSNSKVKTDAENDSHVASNKGEKVYATQDDNMMEDPYKANPATERVSPPQTAFGDKPVFVVPPYAPRTNASDKIDSEPTKATPVEKISRSEFDSRRNDSKPQEIKDNDRIPKASNPNAKINVNNTQRVESVSSQHGEAPKLPPLNPAAEKITPKGNPVDKANEGNNASTRTVKADKPVDTSKKKTSTEIPKLPPLKQPPTPPHFTQNKIYPKD